MRDLKEESRSDSPPQGFKRNKAQSRQKCQKKDLTRHRPGRPVQKFFIDK